MGPEKEIHRVDFEKMGASSEKQARVFETNPQGQGAS